VKPLAVSNFFLGFFSFKRYNRVKKGGKVKYLLLLIATSLVLSLAMDHEAIYAGEAIEATTANFSDAMETSAILEGIYPIEPGMKALGRAITVYVAPGDWTKVVEAIDLAGKGQILVVDASGIGPAVWGELATISAIERGLAGVIINGGLRDVEEIRKLGFPVFAKLSMPNAGTPRGLGEIGVPLKIGSTTIYSGDWIIADDNGVVCVPKKSFEVVSTRAKTIAQQAQRLKEKILGGSTLAREMARDRIIKEVKALQQEIRNLEILASEDEKQVQALELMRNHYRALTERLPDGIMMTTMEGKVLISNKAYRDMIGYTLEELDNITNQQITPKKWHEAEKGFLSLASKESYVYFEKEYIKKDGKVFPVAITGWVIKDGKGEPIGIGSFVEDIGRRKQ